MFPKFSTSDLLFLSGVGLDRLAPEPTDIDRNTPIGVAHLWGISTAIYAYKLVDGKPLVVASSAAGFRWMRPEMVQLAGQAPEFFERAPINDRFVEPFA